MKRVQLGGHRKDSPLRGYALVSDEDYPLISKYKWCLDSLGYASTGWRNSTTKMHYLILPDAPKGFVRDHINGNRLDNRRENLRLVTYAQSNLNRSGMSGSTSRFKGVSWKTQTQSWYAAITLNRKIISLGYFNDDVEAALAYNKAARKYHGEFARLNVIHWPSIQRERLGYTLTSSSKAKTI